MFKIVNKLARPVGYMSQQYAPLEKLTVEQNIEMLGRMRGLNTLDLQKEMDQLLAGWTLQSTRQNEEKDLSGGFKASDLFCNGFNGSPTIILLDD